MTESYFHSVRLRASACIGCVTCVKYCPTEAIRVRNGKAIILPARCIDCGECIRRCPQHAKYAVMDSLNEIKKYAYNIILPPPSLYAQFPPEVAIENIWQGLYDLGFDEIYDVSASSEYIAAEIEKYVKNYQEGPRPLISSACPAVLRLIQVKFPELIRQIIPILSPADAAAIYIKEEVKRSGKFKPEEVGVWFVAPCPAKGSNIRQAVDVKSTQLTGAISVSRIYGELCRVIKFDAIPPHLEKAVRTGSSYGMGWGFAGGEVRAAGIEKALVVHGVEAAYEVLEQISMNKLPDVDYVECSMCYGGCLGGPLTAANKFVAEKNLKQRVRQMRMKEDKSRQETLAQSMNCDNFPASERRVKQLVPRPMMQLDEDIAAAMKKFEKMEEVLSSLPGLDCGACGAPTCQCLAEDIVQGKAHDTDCIFKLRASVKQLAQGMLDLAEEIPISVGRAVTSAKEVKK
ncbi:MAG: 4Fe-4S dicluster domain-containing protein [Acholeplasmataceae bacterium]|nr:[Fe-Fe] hydrogenase large subunit C-terminal domain-containing protein [Acidaminococcaceae bacterium]NLY83765.1 4Fe-4S dicluster domain-containing protein [Acholeplasmataceae bacterium]